MDRLNPQVPGDVVEKSRGNYALSGEFFAPLLIGQRQTASAVDKHVFCTSRFYAGPYARGCQIRVWVREFAL
jgi:hypothetical protein